MNLLDCEAYSALILVKIEVHQDYDCIMHWGIFPFIFWRNNKSAHLKIFSAQNGSTLLTVTYYYLLYILSALDNIQIILCNFNG